MQLATSNGTHFDRTVDLFRGLAEPSRLSILLELSDGARSVSDLAERTGLTQPNTSNHLACLMGCGLVVSERRGRYVFYAHADDHVSWLLDVAGRVASDPARLTTCRHCGSRA